MSFRAELSIDFKFDASHTMNHFPEGHSNRRVHGHSYYGQVILTGTVDPVSGCVVDLEIAKSRIEEVVGELEHRYLNDIPGLEIPSSELVARWIWRKLFFFFLQIKAVVLSRPSVGMSVTYRGEDLVS